MSAAPVPFRVRSSETTYTGMGYEQLETVVSGLARLEDDDLVLQYRVRDKVEKAGMTYKTETSESAVREHRVPLAALRGARVTLRWWWRPRLVLAAADLRAFEGFPAPTSATHELALSVPRAHRADAADLASSIELALAGRLLGGGADRGALPAG